MKVGDYVMLKSGGPKMLVVAIKKDLIVCIWVQTEAKSARCNFHRSMLKLWSLKDEKCWQEECRRLAKSMWRNK